MLLNVNSIRKSFADELLFEDVSFSVDDNDKIGFVGANGAGKSTLIKILLGKIEPDSGEIFKNKFTRIGYLEQFACANENISIYEEVLGIFNSQRDIEKELADIELELNTAKSGDEQLILRQSKLSEQLIQTGGLTYRSRARSALMGLGFSEDELDKKVSALSGGQKTRVALAKILLSGCNLLFLDEPTNHLDIDSMRWLEDFIRSSHCAFIIISHDRYFLDRVTNRTFSLENKKFHSMNLPYTEFARQRDIERLSQKRNYDNTMREIERLEGVIEQQRRWNREKNIKTAESKQKVVDKLKSTLEEPDKETGGAVFRFGKAGGGGDDVLICEGVAKSFGGREVFSGFDLHIRRGERVFLIGPNGCGKTTLLKAVVGELEQDRGTVKIGANIKIGYYDQIQSKLSPDKTVIDEVWDEFPTLTETEVRNALAAFCFVGEDVFKEIAKLSGGERARVELTKLALLEVNFLVLDEPTNHLDIDAREALEAALSGYAGTILAVSHDRYFINRLATRVVYMQKNRTLSFEGGYDYFLEKYTAEKDKSSKPAEKTAAEEYRMAKQQAAKKRKAENDSKKAEARIAELEAEIEKLNTKMSSVEVSSDYQKISELAGQVSEIEKEIEVQYELWDKAQAALIED